MKKQINLNIEDIIKEILCAIKNKLYVVALSSALVLPNYCINLGKSKTRQGKQVGERYKEWCDNYLATFLPKFTFSNLFGSWGEFIFKLRCSIDHNFENDIIETDYKYISLEKFDLFIDDSKDYLMEYPLELETERCSGFINQNKKQNVRIKINVIYLVNVLCSGASLFLNEYNKNNF